MQLVCKKKKLEYRQVFGAVGVNTATHPSHLFWTEAELMVPYEL